MSMFFKIETVENHTHLKIDVEYMKGRGIVMHLLPVRIVDCGWSSDHVCFGLSWCIGLEYAEKNTPKVKKRTEELAVKAKAWGEHIARTFDKLKDDKQSFTELLKAWASQSPSIPPVVEDEHKADEEKITISDMVLGNRMLFFFNFE